MKEDTRKLSAEAQKEKRKIALRMRDKGYTYEEISEVLSVAVSTVGRWVACKKKKGEEAAINGGTRGAVLGQCRTLTVIQEQQIVRYLLINTPNDFGLTDALWTRKSVKALIEQKCAIQMPIRTVGEYLSRWGFTPQKPMKKAYEQNASLVEKWLKEDFPAIKNKALSEKGEIHFGDEAGVRSQCQNGRGYSPVGRTPVRLVSGKKFKVNMISSVTNQGKVRFMLYNENLSSDVFILFLERLILDADRKVFLILDNLRVHKSKVVSEWILKRKDQIELYFLPPYAPELNPDEYLNCDLKYQVHSQISPKNQEDLEYKVKSSLEKIQIDPCRVRKYFRDPFIQYAA
jgi:transposase